MHWVMALLGAFLGAVAGGIDDTFLGLVAGALIGWQGARLSALRTRVQMVEEELVARPEQTAVRAIAPATAARPPGANQAATAASPTPSTTTAALTPAPAATPSVATATAPPTPDSAATPAAVASTPAATPAAAPQAAAARASTTPASRRNDSPHAMPRAPREPSFGDRLGATLKRWLFEGNVPVKLGMLVLFFGVAAALKYALDEGWVRFPIEFRLAAIAVAAFAGLIWGWRNRVARPAFGLSLQGGAIGVLLLTIFAAYRLYALLPAGVAFGLVLVLVTGAAALAVLQSNLWLALLGFIGGYAAPVLISTGSGNHVALFSYYALLNAAVFAVAWKKRWRALNLVGFVFTFVVGTLWGAKYYQPAHFATVEPFLILFFGFYVGIAVLYALRGARESDGAARNGFVDGTLVFGTPLIAFPLQAALLSDDRMGLAYSALAVALLYAVLGVWLVRRRGLDLLGQSFAALAAGFATLAVPLALSARWTSASWALEGAAMVWLGLRQQRFLPKLAGWVLQFLAGAAYVYSLLDGSWGAVPEEMAIINGHALGVAAMALAAFFLSWLHERHGGNRLLVWLGFALGTFWWFVAGVRELVVHWDHFEASLGLLSFAALTAALAALLRGLIPWARLGWLVLAVAICGPLLVLGSRLDLGGLAELRTHGYWLVWIGAMIWGLGSLRTPHQAAPGPVLPAIRASCPQRGLSIAHVLVLATLAWLYGATLRELAADQGLDDGWRYVAGFLPLIALLLATWRTPALGAFPLAAEFPRYRARWFAPALFVLIVSWLAALGERGGSAPLPFVPLINPVELFQFAALLVAFGLARRGAGADGLRNALPFGAFLFLSFAGLRAVHHYTDAPWSPMILGDGNAQTVLTVLWSICGVAMWIYGSRQRRWNVWVAGAILMGVVLVKLVLVDRQHVGNLAGIVSFMAVGALLVLVGRIAPTPPRARADTETEPESETEPADPSPAREPKP